MSELPNLAFSFLGNIFPKGEIPLYDPDFEDAVRGFGLKVAQRGLTTSAFTDGHYHHRLQCLIYDQISAALDTKHQPTITHLTYITFRFIYGNFKAGSASKSNSFKSPDQAYYSKGHNLILNINNKTAELCTYLEKKEYIDDLFAYDIHNQAQVAWSALLDLQAYFDLMNFFIKETKETNKHLHKLSAAYPSLDIRSLLFAIEQDVLNSWIEVKVSAQKLLIAYQKFQSKRKS